MQITRRKKVSVTEQLSRSNTETGFTLCGITMEKPIENGTLKTE
jgi:hypothetical protein